MLEKVQPRWAVLELRLAFSTVQPRGTETAPKLWDTATCRGQRVASVGLSHLHVAWPREMLLENNCDAPPLITDGLGQSRRAAGAGLVSGKTQFKGKMLFTHFSENNRQGNYTLGNRAECRVLQHGTAEREESSGRKYKYIEISLYT